MCGFNHHHLYAHGVLSSAYLGYSMGIAPVISFNYGCQDTGRLKKIYTICLKITSASRCLPCGKLPVCRCAGCSLCTQGDRSLSAGCTGLSAVFSLLPVQGFMSQLGDVHRPLQRTGLGILSFFRTWSLCGHGADPALLSGH
jgi:Na+-driven multidrug efflux pump